MPRLTKYNILKRGIEHVFGFVDGFRNEQSSSNWPKRRSQVYTLKVLLDHLF